MPKLQSSAKKVNVLYPETEHDTMWKWEAEKLKSWLHGRGADIGCGKRSVLKDSIRVDIDEKVEPDICCSGDKLPFKDGELDYITSIHSFEHFDDQHGLLKEWLRVVRVGGIIGIVHPDIQYTKKQNTIIDNPGLKENPYNKHWHENTAETLEKQLREWEDLRFRIIDRGVACQNWSFYLIIEKCG